MNPGSHEPRPEFRAYLEWQIESALRRESRFADPVAPTSRPLIAAVVVLAVLAIGGIAAAASEQVQDARQRDALIETTKAEEDLTRLRVELAKAHYQETRASFEVGTAGRESLQAAERELREMEAALARVRLNAEEIRATSAAPRDDLQAPVVGGRDFVRERLRLELELAQRALVATEQAVAEAQRRVSVGVIPQAVQRQAQDEALRARLQLQSLQATLELRARAVQGQFTADKVAAEQRRLELTLKRDLAQRQIDSMRIKIQELRSQVEVGLARQLELKRAEVELLEREIEVQRLRRELETLRRDEN